MGNYHVKCNNLKEWNVVSEVLGRTDPTKYLEVGDSIDMSNPNSSSFSPEKVLSFDNWISLDMPKEYPPNSRRSAILPPTKPVIKRKKISKKKVLEVGLIIVKKRAILKN